MMFRFLRYLKLIYESPVKPKTKSSARFMSDRAYLMAYFKDGSERTFASRLSYVLLECVNNVPVRKGWVLWRRCHDMKSYDRKYFLGVDLVNSPNRAILCLLKHYGDIDEKALLACWDWAKYKDSIVMESEHILPKRFATYRLAMAEHIENTQKWVDQQKVQQ